MRTLSVHACVWNKLICWVNKLRKLTAVPERNQCIIAGVCHTGLKSTVGCEISHVLQYCNTFKANTEYENGPYSHINAVCTANDNIFPHLRQYQGHHHHPTLQLLPHPHHRHSVMTGLLLTCCLYNDNITNNYY